MATLREIGVPERACQYLGRAGVVTVEDFVERLEDDTILEIRNVRWRTVDMVSAIINEYAPGTIPHPTPLVEKFFAHCMTADDAWTAWTEIRTMKCDRCGGDVASKEDAGLLDAIANGTPFVVISTPRHIRCSPSRAQYIIDPSFGGPVVDDRPEYDKRLLSDDEREEYEDMYTMAWRRLQEE